MVVEPMAGDRVEDNLNTGRPRVLRLLHAAVHAGVAAARTSVWRWARRPVRPRSATSPRPPGSRRSARPRRRRSTTCSRSVRDSGAPSRRTLLGWARHPSRSADPDVTGVTVRDGVELAYEVFHQEHPRPSCWCPPGRSSPSRFWKAQIGFLARHYRVVTFDGRGSGRSGRPAGRRRLHGRGVRRRHPGRAGRDRRPSAAVLVTESCGASLGGARRGRAPRPGARARGDRPVVRARRGHPGPRPRAVGRAAGHAREGWAKYNKHYWLGGGYDDFTRVLLRAGCSPSRTRPSRSRTASAGRTRSRRRPSRTPPRAGSGATARCARRSRRWPGR